jgi:hypothetical protein
VFFFFFYFIPDFLLFVIPHSSLVVIIIVVVLGILPILNIAIGSSTAFSAVFGRPQKGTEACR